MNRCGICGRGEDSDNLEKFSVKLDKVDNDDEGYIGRITLCKICKDHIIRTSHAKGYYKTFR